MAGEDESELLNILNLDLENHKTDKVAAALKNVKFSEIVKNKSWEIIPTICKHIKKDSAKKFPDFVQCCRELLMILAQYANPEEALLEFIDQAECPDDDVLFTSLLEPLIFIHMRLSSRRGDSLKWMLNTVLGHLRDLSPPNVQSYEGPDERKLMDLDPAVVRINNLYSYIIDCIKPLVEEVSNVVNNDSATFTEIKSVLAAFILRLMGGHLCYLDLTFDGKAKSDSRINIENLMKYFSSISCDMMSFLGQVEILYTKAKKKDSKTFEIREDINDEDDAFCIDQIPGKCFAVLYYVLLGEKIEIEKVPFVYDHFYIFQCCIYLSTSLLTPNEDTVMLKGLSLAKAVIEIQMDCSVRCEALDSPVHSTFQKSVINAMIFSPSRECRTLGVKILDLYLKKFDIKGKYLILSSMLMSADHAGLAGFLLVQLKEILNDVLFGVGREGTNAIEHRNLFVGQSLFALVLSHGGCFLAHDAETDLLEASDQILSALNLLRFLAIRDSENVTGFWDYIPVINKQFLFPLREGIDLSRAHYKVKRRDLEEEKKLGKKKRNDLSDVTVTIAGQNIPKMPVDKKILVVESALNTFDLIESLMGRLNECIGSKTVNNKHIIG